jgi:hypothetical protein
MAQDGECIHTLSDLTSGCPVFTADGTKLGKIKEVQSDAFLVNAPLQADYWLCREDVRTAASDQVVMRFEMDRLDEFKFTDPMTHYFERHGA